jgi:AcrR family transcriptional regulator
MSRRRSAASLPRYHAVPTRERTEATRRAIVAAAVHAFRVRGYAATTMSTVAAVAEVSPRTLYRYFGSKSELFAATIAEGTAKFLEKLSLEIQISPLRDAIIAAFEYADFEINEESREMMRLASADEKVWRHFLGATSQIQPTLAVTLRSAAAADDAPAASGDQSLIWDVRASALLGAISTAYRRWAATPGSELSTLVTTAVDAVIPIITIRRHDSL